MALDGALISQIVREVNSVAMDARVDKIHQPSQEEIIVALRTRTGNVKLLISASSANPRFHFTSISVENPKSPPMFCMLLRKHLSSGRFVEAKQIGLDRIVHFIFEATNELGDKVLFTIAVEMMGRHSNVILVDCKGKIVDAVKRINDDMSRVRQVLPGMTYMLPPGQDKINLLEHIPTYEELMAGGENRELSKALLHTLSGCSPMICGEIADFTTRGLHKTVAQLTADNKERLQFFLSGISTSLQQGTTTPTGYVDESGKPIEFSFMELSLPKPSTVRVYESYSLLLDNHYGELDAIERMKQRSHNLFTLLSNLWDRTSRRVQAQREELEVSGNREYLKICGDILAANIYTLQKGQSIARLQNFYSETGEEIEIPLDPMLTPVQNSQKYYNEYRKASTAEKKLEELIQKGEEEVAYLDSVYDALMRTRTEEELEGIRQELAAVGYMKNYGDRYKKPKKLAPIRYTSSDGFTILCGRNNLQNDQLTLKDAKNYDMWFHTQKIPGSHTIVLADGKDIPNRTLEEAAIIAAFNSKARDGSKIAVDYTIIKNVKKPNGAKPGMVIYEVYQTAIVTPDRDLVARLLVK